MTNPNTSHPTGIHNFRSLAGYRLRDGGVFRDRMVYRSGALELMTEEDASLLTDYHGIHTILDLRHPDELAMNATSHALWHLVRGHSIFPEHIKQEELIAELNGLYGNAPSPQRYLHYLDVGGDRLARAFELFAAEENYPVLVHCTAGKDRTGVLLGMVMDVVGCDDDDIANEYGLSDASIDALIAYLQSSGRQLQGSEAEIRARLSTPPERMAGFIKLLREKHGGSEAFFAKQGVSQQQIENVRRLLTARQ